MLEASYEATLLAGALEAAAGHGSGVVLLTFLGGGVFGNKASWIEAAIARACVRCEAIGLRVVVTHRGSVDQALVARLDAAIAAERAGGRE